MSLDRQYTIAPSVTIAPFRVIPPLSALPIVNAPISVPVPIAATDAVPVPASSVTVSTLATSYRSSNCDVSSSGSCVNI